MLTPAQRAKQQQLQDEAAAYNDPEKHNPSADTTTSRGTRGSPSAQIALERFETRSFDPSSFERLAKKEAALAIREHDRKILSKLKRYNKRSMGKHSWIRRHEQQLIQVAHNAFLKRMDLLILVCDVFKDGAKTRIGRLGDVEKCQSWSETFKLIANLGRLEAEAESGRNAMDVRIHIELVMKLRLTCKDTLRLARGCSIL